MVNDSLILTERVAGVEQRQEERRSYVWNEDYKKRWTDIVNPIAAQAEAEGVKVYAITKPFDKYSIDDFRHETQAAYPFYKADDILLKTIIRSNPGVLLWHNGTIVDMWHWRKLPTYDKIKALMTTQDSTLVQ
jgi:hypothetical protein